MIWATVSSQSYFCWLYTASPSLVAKNIINLISVLTIWSLVLLNRRRILKSCKPCKMLLEKKKKKAENQDRLYRSLYYKRAASSEELVLDLEDGILVTTLLRHYSHRIHPLNVYIQWFFTNSENITIINFRMISSPQIHHPIHNPKHLLIYWLSLQICLFWQFHISFVKKIPYGGLPWWSGGYDSELPMQQALVWSVVWELDPTCRN